ncbi:hypothetical protein J4E93_005650 [Alternaria ventricosa]|uniref:uncharacterized protein n=1 Tax=Alternaria ventricosa TaxID=1187951 RepID=UPI0020C28825|nr:uncharacterized protein J4E93_005650 [Alternaria ventricosa]KAI4646071.1 hypothetical protein J4E93_005650 [Alternaria ventricosa]
MSRIEELNAEYEQVLEGQPGKDKEHGPADAYSNEREEHDEQDPAGHGAQGRNGPAGLRGLVDAHEMAVKKSIDRARNMIGAFPSAVDLFPVYGNMRSTVQHPIQVAGGMIGHTPTAYMKHRRQFKAHSRSHTDTASPRSAEVKASPSATRADDEGEEQSMKKKWSTVKVKSGDDDGTSPTADRPNLHSTFFDTFVWPTELSTTSSHARAATRASRSPLPELRTFEDVHRQIREQDIETTLNADNMAALHWVKRELAPVASSSGPAAQKPESATSLLDHTHPKKNAPSQSSLEALCGVHTGQDHSVGCITLKEGISPIDLLHLLDNSDISDIEFEIEDDSAEVKNGDATVGTTTLEPRKFVPTVAEHKKQAGVSVEGLNYALSTDGEDYSDSDDDSVPNEARKDVHPKKPSNVEVVAGSASADSTAAPDDAMVDEFLDFTANAFSRDEVFEILRMCGANLVVAVSMYRNARSLDHIRQMLRAWLAPLENGGLGDMDRQSVQDGEVNILQFSNPSQVFTPLHNAEPTGTTLSVRDAYKTLGLEAYHSVDRATLDDSLHSKLIQCGSAKSVFRSQQLVLQAYTDITKHQNDNDCWELSPLCIEWTEETDEKLIRWKTEDVKITWTAIAGALGMTVKECKDRFKVLRPSKGKANSTKEDKSKKQQDTVKEKIDAVHATSPALGDNYGGLDEAWDAPLVCTRCGMHWCDCTFNTDGNRAEQTAPGLATGNDVHWGSFFPGPQSSGDDAWASIRNPDDSNKAPEPEASASTDYTVTYWATVESGDKTVHIPINSSDVSGPEKNIIESSSGMKKIWKWAQDKGLADKISLQDAFDLAKDMHCKEEIDQPVVEEPQRATDAPRATSYSRSPSRSRSPYPRRAAPAVGLLGVDYIYPNPPYVRPMTSAMTSPRSSQMSSFRPVHEETCDGCDAWSCY